MNELVRILSDDDGELREKKDQYWHLVEVIAGSNGTFCEAEFFGEAESCCKYETKRVNRVGITCPKCLSRLKWCKAVRL